VAWEWERELRKATVTADCRPDHLELQYFFGLGSTPEQALAGARASMAASEEQHGVDCVEDSN
jgi:hypothetical protein